MLTVDRIRTNSETPLLCLPPEVRNQIWGYALGGNVFDVVPCYIDESTYLCKPSAQSLPRTNIALLSVCRQIYAETALLPYKLNAFRFATKQEFGWVENLHQVQRALIPEIRLVTNCVYCGVAVRHADFPMKSIRLPDDLRMTLFPGLDKVVIEDQNTRRWLRVLNQHRLLPQMLEHFTKITMAKTTLHVKRTRPNAEVVLACAP